MSSVVFHFQYPDIDTLKALFDPVVGGQVFPLGVPVADVYTGRNGWPQMEPFNVDVFSGQQPARPASPVSPGVDLRTTAALGRDPATGEIVAAITLTNRGLAAATNVESTEARLHVRSPRWILPLGHTRLATSRSHTQYLHFPALQAGQHVVLRVSGRYLGGTFGGSFRVILP